ncbi:MAG: hypothetical protein HY355_02730 [Armatimonadetes bacterium]|nr:hypothetical protein [Armatimonadota bacterium]
MLIELTPAFHETYPEGIFGALIARGVPNRARPVALGEDQRAVEADLRARFTEDTIDADPVARAYAGYYRRFGARYPVTHQARTILTGRPIESPSALVATMFTAEVHNLVLTSGHDLETLRWPLRVDAAEEGEVYTKLSGKEQRLRAGDMVVRDQEGVIASVLYGPDLRTRLRPESHAVLFGAWCPVGVARPTVETHLLTIGRLIRREWPDAAIDPPLIVAAAA